MEYLSWLWEYILPFLVVLTILVFVHEWGHYWVAKKCGVKIEAFSIGFGPELFGWNDRSGTRWKFSAVPIGGYVRFFGDAEASSSPDPEALRAIPEDQRSGSFLAKSIGQRAAISAAGPAANFLFSIVVLSILFATYGQPFTPAEIGGVQPDSAAAEAGLMAGDTIVSIDGWPVARFEEVQQTVQINPGVPLSLDVLRNGVERTVTATPRVSAPKDRFGNEHRIGLLGITPGGAPEVKQHDPLTAVYQAFRETGGLVQHTLEAIWQMIVGTRGTDELGGAISIARMSGQFAQLGPVALINFMALLSVNLGLINLFPIPMLDGGHLMFYAIEAVRRKPLDERVLKISFRVGLAMVLTLMVFANGNDLMQHHAFDFLFK